MENSPYLITELEDLSTIYTPLKTTTRIKYTCFNTSNSYLIFGATSGSLYVFQREPCCFLQLLPNKEGAVTQVSISPDEKLIAFSTIKGVVCILEKTSNGAKHLITTVEHQNEQITSLQWNDSSNELFVGDNTGKVSIVSISIFPSKAMFQTPSFVLMQLDSKIVQMDFSSNMLLVSTLSKCYICDTKKELFRQVGHKLRDGEYGACIINTDSQSFLDLNKTPDVSNLAHLKLFCARPGSRVWECTIDGTVMSTHHFKEALAVPPKKIYFLNDSSSQNNDLTGGIISNGSCTENGQIQPNFPEQSFNFQKLNVFMSNFLFTFKSDGIYLLDPQKSVVVLWNNEITNIVDVKSANNVIYVWSGFGKLYALNIVPLERFLINLYLKKKYSDLSKFCVEYLGYLMTVASGSNKLYILQDLDEKLKNETNSDKFCEILKPFISICKENAQKRKIENAQKLKSGIYLATRHDQILLNDRGIGSQTILRPSYLNLKGRSHSVSPERFQNGGLKHKESSTSSLPDLINESNVEENINSPVDVVVNTRKKVKDKAIKTKEQIKINTENVSKVVEILKKCCDPTKSLVFSLLDSVLELGCHYNLDIVESLPLDKYFSDDDINLLSNLFHSNLTSKWVFEWFSKFDGDLLKNKNSNHPNFLIRSLSKESLELDYKLSKLIKLFSYLLNEKDIIEILKNTGIECYYLSLLEILNVYQEASLTSVSEAALNLDNISTYPKILNVVYFLINVGQMQQCAKHFQKIDLNDIFYLMLKHEENMKKAGKTSDEMIELQCHTLFLTYLDRSISNCSVLSNCNYVVENYVVNCLENVVSTATSVKECYCVCGFPCSILQPSIAMFPDVGNALIQKNWPENREKCIEICRRIPYLWKQLILVQKNESLDSVLALLLQTGDIEELERRSKEVKLETLEKCIKLLIEIKKGKCLNCGRKIELDGREIVSWTEFGMLSIKLSDPEKTLELFRKHASDICSKELDQTFFQSLIFSFIMDKHKTGFRKPIVNLLGGKNGDESSTMSLMSNNIRQKIFGDKYEKHSNQSSSSTSSQHHWGAKVNFKENCTVCSLPLDTKVLISEVGLVVFRCSHAFHSACLPKVNLKCPICKKQ